MTNGSPMRSWCGVYQWPDKKPFLLGSISVRSEGTLQEVEKAVEAEFDRVWGEILPDDVPRPKLLNLRPGAIWFVPEDNS